MPIDVDTPTKEAAPTTTVEPFDPSKVADVRTGNKDPEAEAPVRSVDKRMKPKPPVEEKPAVEVKATSPVPKVPKGPWVSDRTKLELATGKARLAEIADRRSKKEAAE
jgi:hypothetical protein